MKFEIPDLPYPKEALEPHIGSRTVELHYEKHHKGYLKKLKKAIEGKPEADKSLEDLILSTSGDVFNNAAQVWNHSFYWKSLAPDGGGSPSGDLAQRIDADFGSFDAFTKQFSDAATGEFGSGWAWLARAPSGRLEVRSSSDAENPLQRGFTPLITLDVWEHAYYLDYQNERARYVDAFLESLANWDFAAANLAAAPDPREDEGLQGEGNKDADRRYREGAREFAGSDRLEPAAREAAREVGE